MSVTISNKVKVNDGDKSIMIFDLVVGTYATNGVALTPAVLGLNSIDILLCENKGGVLYSFDHTNNKIQAYRQAIDTSGGFSKPNIDVTDGTALVKGGQPTGVALYLDPNNSSGAIAMTVTGPLSIPAATFGITKHEMAVSAAIAFTGGANAAAAFSEVADAATLSDTVRCIVIGV